MTENGGKHHKESRVKRQSATGREERVPEISPEPLDPAGPEVISSQACQLYEVILFLTKPVSVGFSVTRSRTPA